MVLGLGSRSKKDRASSIASQLVDFHIHLHEIKPWPAQAPPPPPSSSKSLPYVPLLLLRWNRGDNAVGQSKVINPNNFQIIDGSRKILLDESIRISTAPNREIIKKAKKLLPDLDRPLVFSLIEADSPNSKLSSTKNNSFPLAQTDLKMEPFLSMTLPQAFSIPLSVSKKKNNILANSSMKDGPRLHFTIDRYKQSDQDKDDAKSIGNYSASVGNNSGGLGSAAASSASDGSSLPPPIDEDEQRAIVASLLSDEDDDDVDEEEETRETRGGEKDRERDNGDVLLQEEEMESFTDDEEDSPPPLISSRSSDVVRDVNSNLPRNEVRKVNNHLALDLLEKPPGKADDGMLRPTLPSPQASPARAAAIAASTAYTPKRSFLARNVKDEPNSSYSSEEDDLPFRFSRRSPSAPMNRWHMSLRSPLNSIKTTRDMPVIVENTNTVREGASILDAKGNPATISDREGKISKNSSMQGVQAENSIQSETLTNTTPLLQSNEMLRESAESFPIIATKSDISCSPNQLSNENSTKGNFELKMITKQHFDDRKSYGSLEKSNNEVEVIEERFLPIVKSAEDTHKPKLLIVPEIKNVLKSSLVEKYASENSLANTSASPDPVEEKLFTYKYANNQEDAKCKVILAEARALQLEKEIEKLRGELRDVAAVEASLYSATAEHGSSSLKLHAPARRLARVYSFACIHGTEETRAGSARNTMAGLVLVARTCGNDVPRLTFWWSNIIMLREIISSNIDIMVASTTIVTKLHPENLSDDLKLHQQKLFLGDWRDPRTFLVALEQLEGWIYTKVVESIWWQVLTPKMQQPIEDAASEGEQDDMHEKRKDVSNYKMAVNSDLEDIKQGSISVEIWKKAFLDSYERLCPVRRLGVECGCLPMLNKMVLEACIARLDVAMFNAIIRDDETPTDPISDPISDTCVLPIPIGSLSFGLGAQLKNAVSTLSSWLSNLINKDANNTISNDISEESERSFVMFPLLKAMGGLLMLPKDMLIDKSLRKEVCSTLSLTFIGKILSKYQPDEFSPDPVSSELLEAINSEIAADKDEGMTSLNIAVSPPVTYSRPRSSMVKPWIGDAVSVNDLFNRSNSVLRKGHTSDDEIDELESPMSWLLENTHSTRITGKNSGTIKEVGSCSRFRLLREVWTSG